MGIPEVVTAGSISTLGLRTRRGGWNNSLSEALRKGCHSPCGGLPAGGVPRAWAPHPTRSRCCSLVLEPERGVGQRSVWELEPQTGPRGRGLLQEGWGQTCWMWLRGVPGAAAALLPHTRQLPSLVRPEAVLPQSHQHPRLLMAGWAGAQQGRSGWGSSCGPCWLFLL